MSKQWVYYTNDPLAEDIAKPKELLGGKGASLLEMSIADLPVPPAFVISTEACAYFFEHGESWPEGLEAQILENLARLESDMGRRFGQGAQPLLLSVRSGAARSMPGMMDTLLNVGLHLALADEVGDSPAFWHLYGQFIIMYAKTVADMPPETFDSLLENHRSDMRRETVEAMIAHFETESGQVFPREPRALLFACINHVFRSWNNERAVQYRKRHDIHGLRGTGVTVQAMFPSHVSGIVFTRDPNDLSDHLVIEASYGLGEAVVSGDVAPDKFIVDRHDFNSVHSVLGNKCHTINALGDEGDFDPEMLCLDQEHLHELCELALQIERHYDQPMDIEFGLADGKFALLQCRPIRGLDILADVEAGRLEEIERLKAIAGDREKIWVTHNLGETLSAPTPLTWDIVRHFMSGDGGFGRMYLDFGYLPSQQVRSEGFLELICGRIYADPDRLAQLFWAGMPMRYDLEEVVRDPKTMDAAPDHFEADDVEPEFLVQAPRIIWSLIKTSRNMSKARKNGHEVFEKQVLPEYLGYVESKRSQDLASLTTPQVLEELNERRRKVLDAFGPESLKPGFLGGMALAELNHLFSQFDEHGEGASLVSILTTALEADITFEQDHLLYLIARGEKSLDEFIEKFGHRCPGEMELMNPRYREDSSYLQLLMNQLRNSELDPEALHAGNAQKCRQAAEELPERLAEWGASSFREEVEALVQEARRLLPYRERGKYFLMMGYELIRLAILELAERWDIGNDIFFLHLEELERFEQDREALLEAVAARRIRWQSAQKLEVGDVIQSGELDDLGLVPEISVTSSGHWKAEPIASGVASGSAAIIYNPAQAAKLTSGYVLVCPSTDPGWTPFFINARALVVERGGTLSHGAIVARDFGIPAVVLHQATSLIPDGATVRVDGNNGTITLLED